MSRATVERAVETYPVISEVWIGRSNGYGYKTLHTGFAPAITTERVDKWLPQITTKRERHPDFTQHAIGERVIAAALTEQVYEQEEQLTTSEVRGRWGKRTQVTGTKSVRVLAGNRPTTFNRLAAGENDSPAVLIGAQALVGGTPALGEVCIDGYHRKAARSVAGIVLPSEASQELLDALRAEPAQVHTMTQLILERTTQDIIDAALPNYDLWPTDMGSIQFTDDVQAGPAAGQILQRA